MVVKAMIVGERFVGDNNETLKWVQHDVYGDTVGYLFYRAKKRYLSAVPSLQVETELLRRVRLIESFDHRVLQEAHDTIAAHYRQCHDQNRGQSLLAIEGKSYDQQLAEWWCVFVVQEFRAVAEDPDVCMAIITAVGHQNRNPGYEAEDRLVSLLHDRYNRRREWECVYCSQSNHKSDSTDGELVRRWVQRFVSFRNHPQSPWRGYYSEFKKPYRGAKLRRPGG